jgi:uncharacterized protein (TIGR02147 family)
VNPHIINLFEYADFRKFLEDYQLKRQAEDRTFTRSRFCRELGNPNSRSYFNDIVKGNKVLSGSYAERFARVMRLDEEEAQYFRVLVDFNQAAYDVERELLFDQLVALNRTPRKFVDPDQYAFFRRWHYSAVLSILDIHDFRGDVADLAKRVQPVITPAQARESIALLAKLGLIQRRADGVWKASDKTLDAGGYVQDELLKQFQLQCMELAKKSLIRQNPKSTRSFSTVTVSVSGPASDLIEKKLQKFKAEVRAIAHKDDLPADRVYHLNLHYFPQSNLEKI